MLGGMPDTSRASRRHEVVSLCEQGMQFHDHRDLPAALERYQQACQLVREMIEDDPSDADNPQQLGSMLYTLGQWQLEAADYGAALRALTEAESSYQKLGAEAGQLIADVVLRRARAHAAFDRPLSAVADAQQAVMTSLGRIDSDVDGSRGLDAARVVALASEVQLSMGGDPDLAVGAADWALRTYLTGYSVGDAFRVPVGHGLAVKTAARVAAIVHTAAGRTALADAATSMLTAISGEDVPPDLRQIVEQVRARATLAQVLGEAGRHDLADQLTAPATEARILVPAMRCPLEIAPAAADALSKLQREVPAEVDLRLGIEAHALFAAASRSQVHAMRYQFADFGPSWAVAVLNAGQRLAGQGETAAVLDAAMWLTSITGQLLPFTIIDPDVRTIAADCLRWAHDVNIAVRDANPPVAGADTAARDAELSARLLTTLEDDQQPSS
jgi:tetratricopeptide (TPR) repeat protein